MAEQQGDIQKAQEFQRQIDELDNKTDRLVSGERRTFSAEANERSFRIRSVPRTSKASAGSTSEIAMSFGSAFVVFIIFF